MSGGQVQQMGTPEEIYDKPSNVFVAGFVGSPAMNFVSGEVMTSDGQTLLRGDTWELPLSAANAARAKASQNGEVILGIRHGHLRVLPETAPTGLPARIYTVEPTGDVTFVHVHLGNHLLVASTTDHVRGTPDQPVKVELDQDHLYLFDRQSQLAL
jgi:multiple sugar transport system ATP-binding protein